MSYVFEINKYAIVIPHVQAVHPIEKVDDERWELQVNFSHNGWIKGYYKSEEAARTLRNKLLDEIEGYWGRSIPS